MGRSLDLLGGCDYFEDGMGLVLDSCCSANIFQKLVRS